MIIVLSAAVSAVPRAYADGMSAAVYDLNYPSTAVIGTPVTLSFSVAYWSFPSPTRTLLLGAIGCVSPPTTQCNQITPSIVFSNPLSCNPTYPFGAKPMEFPATCYSYVSGNGNESFSFTITLGAAGVYSLVAMGEVKAWDEFNTPGHWIFTRIFHITACNIQCTLPSDRANLSDRTTEIVSNSVSTQGRGSASFSVLGLPLILSAVAVAGTGVLLVNPLRTSISRVRKRTCNRANSSNLTGDKYHQGTLASICVGKEGRNQIIVLQIAPSDVARVP